MGPQNPLTTFYPQGSGLTLKTERDEWEEQMGLFGGEPMELMGSTDSNTSSGNSSTFSWQNLPNTPKSLYMDSYGGTGYEADGYVLPSSLNHSSFSQPYSSCQDDSRPTSKTLGWTPSSNLFLLYKFVVPKGQEPYFELLTGAPDNHKVTPASPPKVYLEQSAASDKFPCMYPLRCDRDPFGRQADLERHYRNYHADISQKETWFCDYGNSKCNRHKEPFTRKDHYRDHLKDFHKEDIGSAKRGKEMSDRARQAAEKQWRLDRKIYSKNWRCVRCLYNNIVAETGWDCSECKQACELERREAREKLQSRQPKREPRACMMCDATHPGWFNNGVGSWDACPGCTPAASSSFRTSSTSYY